MSNLIPKTGNSGTIGTSEKPWAEGYFQQLFLDGENLTQILAENIKEFTNLDSRPLQTQTIESEYVSGARVIFSDNTGPGSVETLSFSTGGDTTDYFIITVDGEELPAIPVGLFFNSWKTYANTSAFFITDRLAYTDHTTSGHRDLFIPYTESCQIVLHTDGTLWSQIEFRQGEIPACRTQGYRKKLGIAVNSDYVTDSGLTVASAESVDLLPMVNAKGVIDSVQLIVLSTYDNGGSPGFLEADPLISLDGKSFKYVGTEDFFGTTYYGENTVGKLCNKAGFNFNADNGVDGYCAAMYRFFDQMTFSESARFQWSNGQSGQSNNGAIQIQSLVIYYYDNTPTGIPVNTSSPTISGVPSSGNTLNAGHGKWSQFPTSYTYQLQYSNDNITWENIVGNSNSFYTVVESDLGKYLRWGVTASNSFGNGEQVYTPSVQIVTNPWSAFALTQSGVLGTMLEFYNPTGTPTYNIESNGGITISLPNTSVFDDWASVNDAPRIQTISSLGDLVAGNWTMTAKLNVSSSMQSNYNWIVGPVVVFGNYNHTWFGVINRDEYGEIGSWCVTAENTAIGGDVNNAHSESLTNTPLWMRISKTDNDYIFSYSVDGNTWIQHTTWTGEDVPTNIGIGLKDWNPASLNCTFDSLTIV